MHWLLIIVGINASSTNPTPHTAWSDHPTLEACKQAGIVAERVEPQKGYTITGMSCIRHDADNTVDFHFRTDGEWQ